MKYAIMLISAYIMGCLAAIPAGPVQIEVVRRSVNGHLKSSLMVILGAFMVDIMYGIIAFFGIAPILEDRRVMVLFWLAGGVILLILGILIIRHSSRDNAFGELPAYLRKKRWGFIGGISLSATNPVMILWWLAGMRIFMDIGLITDFTHTTALSFLAACGLGLASYLFVMSLFLYWAKRFISVHRLRQLNIAFGVFLFLIAGYLILSSFRVFMLQA